MATRNLTDIDVIEQLKKTDLALHAQKDDLLTQYAMFCHRVSALPILSGTLAVQVAEGEPYEFLARGIGQLHKNITEIAEHAEWLCQMR